MQCGMCNRVLTIDSPVPTSPPRQVGTTMSLDIANCPPGNKTTISWKSSDVIWCRQPSKESLIVATMMLVML